ncbi:MAG: class I SAM-dependent methyltransferase [Acidimicrobiia bacterium]
MDARTWDEKYRAAQRLWSKGPNLFVADRLRPVRPGRGLDLASGEGRNAIWLADQGWEMTAVDFSEVAVERGREQSDAAEWVRADVLGWEPPSGTRYDLVLIAYLQIPEDPLEKVVRRAVTWLAGDGEIFLIGHDRSNLEHGHGGPQVPEVLWDVDTIVSWLEGLEITEAGVVRRPVETDGGVVYALDTLVRARASRGREPA